MKHWRIIAISFLALAPLAVFGAISQYENPLGCGLTSLPQFIKAILTIVVKVGVPIATLFIIWSGFLFLTAQGDETQLTKAKKSFLWSCVGTAVLLGSWLLATAINSTIQSLGGGTSGGTGTTIDGGCNNNGGTTSSPMQPTNNNVALACPQNMAQETNSPPYVSLNLENNPFSGIFPETNQCSFGNSMDTLVDWAKELPNENSYLFMKGAKINGKIVDVTLDVNEGTSAGTVLANPNDVQQLLTKYNPSEVYLVHTHPLDTVGAGSKAQPSSIDIFSAINYGVSDPRVKFAVADSTGVWVYNPPVFSPWLEQASKVQQNAALPGAPAELNGADACGQPQILANALSGQYGPESKAWADKIMADSGEYVTASTLETEAKSGVDTSTERMLTVAERNERTNQSVSIIKQLGVSMDYYSQNQLSSCPSI